MLDDKTPHSSEFVAGNELCDGRFIVERFIKSGLLGAAYLCRDRLLEEEHVVCKIAHKDDDASWEDMRLQFRKLKRIASRDVVDALGFFGHRVGAGRGRALLELEWIDGTDFEQWATGVDVHKHLQAAARVAAALAELHDEGLAHGDLYFGGNVRVTSDRVVLIDVGTDLERWAPKDADRRSLAELLERLLPAYARGTLSVVIRGLRDTTTKRLTMKDIAAQVAAAARNVPLVDLSTPLLRAAAISHKETVEQRDQRYVHARTQRALTIESLANRIRPVAEEFGFSFAFGPADPTFEARDPAVGLFGEAAINVTSTAAPGLRWLIHFEPEEFPKPLPPYIGRTLIARGTSRITSNHGHKREDKLEIRFDANVPELYVAVERPEPVFPPRQWPPPEEEPRWRLLDDEWVLECVGRMSGKKIQRG